MHTASDALCHLPAVTVTESEAAHVAHGRRFPAPAGSPLGQLRLVDDVGRLLAVAEHDNGLPLRFAVVMAAPV